MRSVWGVSGTLTCRASAVGNRGGPARTPAQGRLPVCGEEAPAHTRTVISGSPWAPLHLQDGLVGKLRAWTPAQAW